MPQYKYHAVTLNGSQQSGRLEAATETQLSQLLFQRGLYLTSSRLMERSRRQRKIKLGRIADFCRQLAAMLSSGITLIRAIQIIEARDELAFTKKIYANLVEELRRGSTLSESMAKQGKAFPELLVNMMRAGENSGGIDTTALKMAETYDKQNRLNSKIRSAMIYPIILLVLIVLVIIVMFAFVVPTFGEMFPEESELPLPTVIMMSISNFLLNYWYVLAGGVVALAFILTTVFRRPKPKWFWHRLKLHSPVFGKLLRIIYTARFARTLSSLYTSGIPMIQALTIGRSTIGNTYIEGQFDTVLTELGNGRALSDALSNVEGFDTKLYATVAIGEESGRLEMMLDSVADQFDYESEIATQRLVSILEPVMIVIMAVVVLLVIISVLLPIFSMYSSLG
ncbi:MAG: type II secretion system F family protein [Coriobacteriales bacterium]|jgi:type IV pilus assembly protein PilC|nr:type II secretion system F family protein [Coriobacteriales bacterium]